MQTNFTLAQLADPDVAGAEKILRSCVHCGFCTATCPTYVLLGDELDSPRGRIYLIKDMLESNQPASEGLVKHIDRCLSCLSCMTTCPSGVDYMHLVDFARTRIEDNFTRPLFDRLLRALLAFVLPIPERFRLALAATVLVRPLIRFLARHLGFRRLSAMLALAPKRIPRSSDLVRPQVFAVEGPRRARVALLSGCAQQVLAPEINAATIRLLNRHGVEVVVAKGTGCCGALGHHMGKHEMAHSAARANVAAWTHELETAGLDAIVVNTSGCGTTVKDYGHMLRGDELWEKGAAHIGAMTMDITEFLAQLGLVEPVDQKSATVAYHSACSMQHGQGLTSQPKDLLSRAGFAVKDVPEGHLCCGSAGTYNLLQPDIAEKLRRRKVMNIESLAPDIIATGNIGCMTQLAIESEVPIVHTVELLDWATGGPVPAGIKHLG